MADDRPANDDLAAVVAELRRDLADLRGTALARAGRSPTGDIEPTIRTTPKPDTLLLQGQTLNRADYPVLWQWIVDQSLAPSVFGNGNGSTTFALPDLRGRAVVGATAARAVGTLFGAATTTLATTNLPSHNHTGSTNNETQRHTHGGSTGLSGGNHGEHVDGTWDLAGARAPAPNYALRSKSWIGNNNTAHYHNFDTNGQDAFHTHSFTTGNTGSGTAFNTEDPAISVNWLIWT